MHFFLISTMDLGLLHQLMIFWQLYLIELLSFSGGLGLLKLLHLTHPTLEMVCHAVPVHKLRSFEFAGVVFHLILSFLWNKRLQVASFVILHLSYYKLMTFLMMLSVILSILMKLLSLSMIVCPFWVYSTLLLLIVLNIDGFMWTSRSWVIWGT